ncbi:MAG: hypothetical protein PHW76_07985 [Alphaproteobacteria bacterium]|nr:hypothetical protein [Alphaproteobacteria bacterium]
MKIDRRVSRAAFFLLLSLAACGDPRAVVLPLTYPDGSLVTTAKGEPVLAGFQTYGSSTHSNATALYDRARPPTCATCARLGAVVSEPSTIRQATNVLGATTMGAGAVMTGVGMMDYGIAAGEGKLGTNYYNSEISGENVEVGDKNYDSRDRIYNNRPTFLNQGSGYGSSDPWGGRQQGAATYFGNGYSSQQYSPYGSGSNYAGRYGSGYGYPDYGAYPRRPRQREYGGWYSGDESRYGSGNSAYY